MGETSQGAQGSGLHIRDQSGLWDFYIPTKNFTDEVVDHKHPDDQIHARIFFLRQLFSSIKTVSTLHSFALYTNNNPM